MNNMRFILCFFIFFHCLLAQNVEFARYLFEEGHRLASAGKSESALAHFRGACRLNSASYLYWNDLGVTEMRMGLYLKAEGRFLKSLSLNASFTVAKENLEDTVRFLILRNIKPKSHCVDNGVIEHTLVAIRSITREEFRSMNRSTISELLTEPFIIKRYIRNHKVMNYFQLDNLLQNYGDKIVDYYPHNMKEEDTHPFLLKLNIAIPQLTAPQEVFLHVDTSEPGTYLQLNLDQGAYADMLQRSKLAIPSSFDYDYWTQACLLDNPIISEFFLQHHWQMLVIGEQGAGMFLHQDILRLSSYQMQLQGHKKWYLCSGSQSPYLYFPGQVNLFEPDYETFPLLRNATCSTVTLRAGDLLYYPGDYWHQTLNEATPSIAITGTVITKQYYQQLYDKLQLQCDRDGKKEVGAICQRLSSCLRVWRDHFGQRQADVYEEL